MSSTYPLEDLLRVRKFREEAAASEVTKCRIAVEQAAQLLVDRQQALKEYIEWRIGREKELYEEILRQEIQLRKLDDLKLEIQQLRDRESVYEDQIHEAEKGLQQAQEALEGARAAYHEAYKNVEKIDEHKEIWAQEERKLSEEFEEKELEDFHVKTDNVSDDDDDDEETDDA